MVAVIGSLSAFYHDAMDIGDPHHREISAHRLIAKTPMIAALCYKHAVGEPVMYPRNELSYTGNLLRMMFATPCEDYVVDPLAGSYTIDIAAGKLQDQLLLDGLERTLASVIGDAKPVLHDLQRVVPLGEDLLKDLPSGEGAPDTEPEPAADR